MGRSDNAPGQALSMSTNGVCSCAKAETNHETRHSTSANALRWSTAPNKILCRVTQECSVQRCGASWRLCKFPPTQVNGGSSSRTRPSMNVKCTLTAFSQECRWDLIWEQPDRDANTDEPMVAIALLCTSTRYCALTAYLHGIDLLYYTTSVP
jgi:hypothetical protein